MVRNQWKSVNDEIFYHVGDLTLSAGLDSGIDLPEGPSWFRSRPEDTDKDNAKDQKENSPMDDKGGKANVIGLGEELVGIQI